MHKHVVQQLKSENKIRHKINIFSFFKTMNFLILNILQNLLILMTNLKPIDLFTNIKKF